MFQNVIMPEVRPEEMRGLMALLSLIANPQSDAAKAYLEKLAKEKDAAADHHKAANEARAETAKMVADIGVQSKEIDSREQVLVKRAAELDAQAKQHHSRAAQLDTHAANIGADRTTLRGDKMAHEVAKQKLVAATEQLDIREKKLNEAAADLERRKAEFEKIMAPILAASKL